MREEIKNTIDLYRDHGKLTTSWLRTALLFLPIRSLVNTTETELGEIRDYIDCHIPTKAQGSDKNINTWIANGGLSGSWEKIA
jgi:hypothetical protein